MCRKAAETPDGGEIEVWGDGSQTRSFLYVDEFDIRLDALIAAEVARKTEAEERLRKKLEAEKQNAIDDALKAQQAEANRIAREAEAEAIAEKAKQEAAQSTVQVKDAESLKQDIRELSDANARFPEKERAESIKRLKTELSSIQQQSNPAPEGSVIYKVQVEYKVKHVFEFTSKPRADQDKIKAYFRSKAVKDLNINHDDILTVNVL